MSQLIDYRNGISRHENSENLHSREQKSYAMSSHAILGERSCSKADSEIVDEEIVELIYQALLSTGYRQFLELKVYCHTGCVTLQGQLPTYFLKQVAAKATSQVGGVRSIDNDIKVTSKRD